MLKKLAFIVKGLRISHSFKEKLDHNFHELTFLEMMLYLIFIRWSWAKERRFFFEGSLRLMGQMYIADRRALYESILKYEPKQCFEIGTYTGGGSTYFLASAFNTIGNGKLITMESYEPFYRKAINYYEAYLPDLRKHIDFVLGDLPNKFEAYIKKDQGVDAAFFDGSDDYDETISQYNFLYPYFHSGSIIMMHDWNTKKMEKLRPIITNDLRWEITSEIQPPESVGFAIAKMR